jgi:phosphatidylglycerophosphatase A
MTRTEKIQADPKPGLAVRIATCGPVGFLPGAPGTGGAALGLAAVYGLTRIVKQVWIFRFGLGALSVGIFFLGVWACSQAEAFFGMKDPAHVVLDEFVGQMIPFLFAPHTGWKWLLAGLVLFRFFDVVKPFPARSAERMRSGWGIMLDDGVAGAYAAIVLWLPGCLT